jgi:transposase InsO family protein
MAESTIGLYKAELIHRQGPWRTPEQVETATLEYIDWWNNRRLPGVPQLIRPIVHETCRFCR